MKCRHCGSELNLPFVDLGSAPPSNAYLSQESLSAPETWFPLRVLVCERCWLVQTEDFTRADELFDRDYAYFSSISRSWDAHAARYVTQMISRFGLDGGSHVVEVAANDGYLLRHALAAGIQVTGIEPTASTAAAARTLGIPVVEEFFGSRLAGELVTRIGPADLMPANNVLAHVPDINDFVAGFAVLLKPRGVATFEFPHLLRLVEGNQFDTIYHEHFSYLSLTAVDTIFTANGLRVFDVEEHPTHGGSLRVFAQRAATGRHPREERLETLLRREAEAGIASAEFYRGFQSSADVVKNEFLRFLIDAKAEGSTVAAYGAAAKGNTLMNYAGVRPDLVGFVVDRNPAKQGRFMPGSRIPIVDEARLRAEQPKYIAILPWNLRTEIEEQLAYIADWNGRFFTAVPQLEVVAA